MEKTAAMIQLTVPDSDRLYCMDIWTYGYMDIWIYEYMDIRNMLTGYRLQATGYRLQATGYRLQATGYRLQATVLPTLTSTW